MVRTFYAKHPQKKQTIQVYCTEVNKKATNVKIYDLENRDITGSLSSYAMQVLIEQAGLYLTQIIN